MPGIHLSAFELVDATRCIKVSQVPALHFPSQFPLHTTVLARDFFNMSYIPEANGHFASQMPLKDEDGDHKIDAGYGSDKIGSENELEQATLHEGEAKFKKLGWKRLTICLIVEAIALGALSVPSAFASLGMVAGVILSVGIGFIAIYTSYVVGQVKIKYPHVEQYVSCEHQTPFYASGLAELQHCPVQCFRSAHLTHIKQALVYCQQRCGKHMLTFPSPVMRTVSAFSLAGSATRSVV